MNFHAEVVFSLCLFKKKICISACKDAQRAWEGPDGASLTMVGYVRPHDIAMLINHFFVGVDSNFEGHCASDIEGSHATANVRPFVRCCSGTVLIAFSFWLLVTRHMSDAFRYMKSLGNIKWHLPPNRFVMARWIISRTLRYIAQLLPRELNWCLFVWFKR